jgi:aspartyl protease family protein
VIGWALRWLLLCCGIALLGVGILDRGTAFLADRAAQPRTSARVTASAEPATGPASNTLVYPVDARGHVTIGAAVNGVSVRFLVDTGASLVTLTPEDARTAGILRGELVFNRQASTANGPARMALVTLREVRIEQLSIYDVPAAVLENLNVSLLGMSFLGRLQSYEMHDGKLTIKW